MLRSGGDRVGQAIECGGLGVGGRREVLVAGGEDAARVAQRQVDAKVYVVAQEAGGDARPRRVGL